MKALRPVIQFCVFWESRLVWILDSCLVFFVNAGYGQPLDNIDRACFDFKQCYHCLKEQDHLGNIPTESGKCIGEEVEYAYNLNVDDQTGEKSIECTNRPGTCARNICECDKKLAEQLSKYESEWDESLHEFKGEFILF